jgi:crossover junction endodeoxyribonuclease RuvC
MTIGIDPGLGGAIAVYDADGYRSEEMPVMATGAKGKRCINPLGVKELLQAMGNQTVYLEKVHSMPQNGGAANFSFGDSFGCLRGVIMTMGYPLVLVTPQMWKKHYRLTSDKEMCRARAIELFPEESFNRKKDVDRAEALLIAYYGVNQ